MRYQVFVGETVDTMHYRSTWESKSEAEADALAYAQAQGRAGIPPHFILTAVRMHPDDAPRAIHQEP